MFCIQIIVHQGWHYGHEFKLSSHFFNQFADAAGAVTCDGMQANIDRIAPIIKRCATAPKDRFPLEESDMVSFLGEKGCHRKSADSTANDDDIIMLHYPPIDPMLLQCLSLLVSPSGSSWHWWLWESPL